MFRRQFRPYSDRVKLATLFLLPTADYGAEEGSRNHAGFGVKVVDVDGMAAAAIRQAFSSENSANAEKSSGSVK